MIFKTKVASKFEAYITLLTALMIKELVRQTLANFWGLAVVCYQLAVKKTKIPKTNYIQAARLRKLC